MQAMEWGSALERQLNVIGYTHSVKYIFVFFPCLLKRSERKENICPILN